MSDYQRLYIDGGCYFFTVVTWRRQKLFSSIDAVQLLKNAFKSVMQQKKFTLDAIVVLPDHLHCIMRLPAADHDYSGRWREIKKHVTKRYKKSGDTQVTKIWQPRFWEHLIRDEEDWRRHMDYIHYNPVKHGYVAAPADWPHSSFNRCVEHGLYPREWGDAPLDTLQNMDLE